MPTTGPVDDAETQAQRYRRAAEETLDQLQWCIDYLYRTGKRALADALAKNHRTIRERLEDTADP